jgi:hypothetical protein
MTRDAANGALIVRTAVPQRVRAAVVTRDAGIARLMWGDLSRIDDLADVTAGIDVLLARSMAALAGVARRGRGASVEGAAVRGAIDALRFMARQTRVGSDKRG